MNVGLALGWSWRLGPGNHLIQLAWRRQGNSKEHGPRRLLKVVGDHFDDFPGYHDVGACLKGECCLLMTLSFD